jgi:carnitine O-acetyltransferase
VTPEVLEFVAEMDNPRADPTSRRRAFLRAAERHVQRIRDCQQGRAPEQHLWELDMLRQRQGSFTRPFDLYRSPGWLRMREDYLSTSSTYSPNVLNLGFGPTSQNCIGIGYSLSASRLDLHLSAPRAAGDGLHRLAHELPKAVAELSGLSTRELTDEWKKQDSRHPD